MSVYIIAVIIFLLIIIIHWIVSFFWYRYSFNRIDRLLAPRISAILLEGQYASIETKELDLKNKTITADTVIKDAISQKEISRISNIYQICDIPDILCVSI